MLVKIQVWILIHVIKRFYGFSQISTKLIFAQAVHETGNFESTIFRENKNLFGMRQPSVRKSYASGSARGHATYRNLFNSVRDYFERQRYFKVAAHSDEAFIVTTVGSNYAEDKNYESKWRNLAAAPVPGLVRFSGYIATAVFIVLVFFLFKAIAEKVMEIIQENRTENKKYGRAVQRFQITHHSKN